ncbi:ATP-binding cassette domain-containing protein [Nonomuraea sp. NPDC000554]|uniref:ATP-binding cassette domain-containing protein n=1 Tax=Nonomuraea sp. NPDC000554 TaxID=3154259 RepID=UPI00331D5571
MIEVRDLQVRYGTRTVARVPELDVAAGECVAIVGESGSGKSTTLLSLLGLTEGAHVSGDIRVCGVDVLGASPRRLREIRGARVALVMQSPQAALSPTTRLGTLMRRALQLHGVDRPPKGERPDGERADGERPDGERPDGERPDGERPDGERAGGERADGERRGGRLRGGLQEIMAEAVRAVMLDPEILRRYPHEISGGQAQRFAIALAIALGAEVILADEPTSALDVTVQAEVVGVLRRLREERGLALLLVSHDLALVSTIADRVLVMKDGEVVETGPAAEVLAAPSHPYTRDLLEALP